MVDHGLTPVVEIAQIRLFDVCLVVVHKLLTGVATAAGGEGRIGRENLETICIRHVSHGVVDIGNYHGVLVVALS